MNPHASGAWIDAAIGHKKCPASHRDEAARNLEESLGKIYKAVAFDIDGTLTLPDSSALDPRLCLLVAKLLRRGCHVWLITGRGSSGARSFVSEIFANTDLAPEECLRLKAVAHNGGQVQEFDPQRPGARFSVTNPLLEPYERASELADEVSKVLKDNNLVPRGQTMEPAGSAALGMRVVFPDVKSRDFAAVALKPVAEKYPEITLKTGIYGTFGTIDLTTADKADSVALLAQREGIDPAYVLCVGDQGHVGGNDESFLAGSTGFSVGSVSSSPTGCFPVVEDGKVLEGAEATLYLFTALWIGAPLRKQVGEETHRVELQPRLREFERSAVQRSGAETQMIERQLSVRIAQLINHDPGDGTFDVTVGDLFDRSSGGVRLHEWDIPEVQSFPEVEALFNFAKLERQSDADDGPSRCMYTDSAVLLRGPDYYMNLTGRKAASHLPQYLDDVQAFVTQALKALNEIHDATPTEALVRVAMAIYDNVRDILLQLLNVALFNAQPPTETCTEVDHRFVNEIGKIAGAHTCEYIDFLLEPHRPWGASIEFSTEPIVELQAWLAANSAELAARTAARSTEPEWETAKKEDTFRWREADDLVQNISAVVMGLRAVAARPDEPRRFLAIGLQYGGLELPLLATALGTRFGLEFVPAAMRVSMYSDAGGVEAEKDLDGWIRSTSDVEFPVTVLNGTPEGDIPNNLMLFDDNCTTGRTVQAARDMLVRRGNDVHAVVIVRFPGANRAAHMGLPDHGYLDIDLAHNFVHGLVGPSPYSRLVVRHPGMNKYEDENGVFDKAKLRVRLLLHKNSPNKYPMPPVKPWGISQNAD